MRGSDYYTRRETWNKAIHITLKGFQQIFELGAKFASTSELIDVLHQNMM